MTSDDPTEVAKDIGPRTKSAADRARGGLSDAASTAADHASDAAGKVSDKATDVYQRVRDGASDFSDKLPGSASDAVDAGKRAYTKSNDQLARTIGQQPIEALLLAGAIGYLVGWAANRS